jgi:hypothetical protein
MFYDIETRMLIAQEHMELLRAQAENYPGNQRTRRWLSEHLIAAGMRLAPDSKPHRQPVRAV